MGCIVNGPGEMADADFGYVGTGPGVIASTAEGGGEAQRAQCPNAVDELVAPRAEHGIRSG